MWTHKDFFYDRSLPDTLLATHKKMCETLGEGVDAALKFFLRYAGDIFDELAAQHGNDIHMIPSLMVLDFAEATDGISILVKHGAAKTVFPLMRQALELYLLLRYITHARGEYARRCIAYEYWHLRNDLATAKKHDSKVAASVEAVMSSPRYDPVRHELARMESDTAKKQKVRHWYQLWGGPATVQQMAALVGTPHDYEYYRSWSSRLHGATAVSRLIVRDGEKKVRAHRLRLPTGIQESVRGIVQLTVTLTIHLVKWYLPDREKDAGSYFEKNVEPHYACIQSYDGV